jgi:hypothetical protein
MFQHHSEPVIGRVWLIHCRRFGSWLWADSVNAEPREGSILGHYASLKRAHVHDHSVKFGYAVVA